MAEIQMHDTFADQPCEYCGRSLEDHGTDRRCIPPPASGSDVGKTVGELFDDINTLNRLITSLESENERLRKALAAGRVLVESFNSGRHSINAAVVGYKEFASFKNELAALSPTAQERAK